MSSPLIKILMTWNLKQKDERYVAKLFLKLFDKLPTLDQKMEILFVLADFEPRKLKLLYKYLRPIIVYLIRSSTFARLRVLMLYYARKCPDCLKLFMETFKSEIREKLERLHFNDFIVFSLDLARINAESGASLIRTFKLTLKSLAQKEGFTHFGTVLWHMLMMNQKDLAYLIFDALLDVISAKAKYLSDIQDLIELINRVDTKFAHYVLVKLEPKIRELFQKANQRERERFLRRIPVHNILDIGGSEKDRPSNIQFLNDKW